MAPPGVKAILDTSTLIAAWRPPESEQFAISVASLAELHFGILRAAGTKVLSDRLRRLGEIEHEFDPIPFDSRVARAYAVCAEAVVREVRNPRPRAFDLVIAATALVERAKLYTFNADDFRGLESLVEVVVPKR